MDPAEKLAIDNAERAGYLPALRSQARAVCVPFWWHGVAENGAYKILNNGSVTFVDTGVRQFAVTADHVVAGYLAALAQNRTITCQLGGSTFELGNRLIDRDARLDIATFEVSEPLVGAAGGYFHHPLDWPPPAVQEGDVVFAGGYPGELREEHLATADLPFQWYLGRAGNFTERSLSFYLDPENVHRPLMPGASLNRDIGGMSGGPVFQFVQQPLERLVQVGVIREGQFGLLLATPLLHVRADGTLQRINEP